MKKTSLITAAFLFVGLLLGVQAMAQNIDLRTNAAQKCVNVTEDGFTATFSFSGIQASEISTEKGVFSEIKMDGTYLAGNLGEPSLPVVNKLIAVPYGARVAALEVKSFSTTTYRLDEYGIKTVMPQQPSVRKDQKPEDVKFVYSEKAYAAKSLSQRPLATIEMRGTMRGIQVGALTINPVNYNPATNSIEVYNNIEVEVRYDNYDKTAAYNEFARTFSPYFAGVYKTMFNWRDDVYDEHPDLWQCPVKMLVIADRMFEECMQEWVEWKTMKGFYMDVNYTDEIGSNASAIRSFIQSKYAEDAPTFVIIFGDKNQVPASGTGTETNKVTDLQYMSVDNDDFPDIYHSRMCAETVDQMTNIISKTLWYERDQFETPDRNIDYLGNVLLIAGWDGTWNPRVGKPTIQYALEYYYNTEHGFNNVYNWLQQPYTGCYEPLNTGVGFVNYTAHGGETSWSEPGLNVSDVNNFTNIGMPFLAMGNCCLAADWGYGSTSFGEAMIRNNMAGAYAYIGSCPSTYWWEDYYFAVGATSVANQMPTYEQTAYGCYDAVWDDDVFNTVSAIPFIGNIAVCYGHANGYQGSVSDKYYWQAYHALGDGSVMPFRVQPVENEVTHMPTLPIGVDTYTVEARPGSYVSITKEGFIHGTGLIDETGSADIPIIPVTSGGDVTICVTHPQCMPYIQVVPAAAMDGAYIAFDHVECEQPLVSGAYVAPTVSLKNVGIETANDVQVELSTESEYIDLISTSAVVPSIDPDAVYDIVDAFAFDVAVNIPNKTKVRFFLTCTAGDDIWENKFDLTFGAPDFYVSSITNTELQPGGPGTIMFEFGNGGLADAQDAILEVFSSSDDIQLENNTFELGTIEQGTTTFTAVGLTVAAGVEIGATYEISYVLSSGHYSKAGSYIMTVGNIVEGFETGDFSMYDWQTSGGAQWTVVDSQAHTGLYSAKSGAISHNQQTDLVLTIDILANGEVSFYKKISTESGWDKLYFYIDNVEKNNWSGNEGWSQEVFPVTVGTHTFKWSYQKDGSVSSGDDCVWIDDIQFPPTSVTLALDPINDLNAVVVDQEVTLSWTGVTQATAYSIRRDGEEIAFQSRTEYIDFVEDGIYTYTVVATDENGHYSAPASVAVSVGIVGVSESEESFSVYPNPVSNMLNIEGVSGEYSYTLFNGMGQMVVNGNAIGNTQINVNGMAKGVYFLRLVNGTQVRVEKVMVE